MDLYSFLEAAAATGRGDRMASKDKPWPRRRRALQEDIWSKRVEKSRRFLDFVLLNEGRAERERDYCRMYVTSMPKGAKRECKRSGTVSNMNLKPNHCTAAFPPRLPIGWQGRASRGQSPTSSNKYCHLTQHLRLHQYEPFICKTSLRSTKTVLANRISY